MNTYTKGTSARRRFFGLLPARAVIYVLDTEPWPETEETYRYEWSVIHRDACRLVAERLGLEIVDSFRDWTPSAQRLRSELEYALRRACAGDVEYLIVFSLDHLDGGLDSQLNIGLTLGAAGTDVLVVTRDAPELASRVPKSSR